MTSREVRLEIFDLSRNGAGVAKLSDGKIIFVPYTAPGDQVIAQIVDEKKDYARAKLLELLKASPLRIEPKCSVFGQCGGCDWQHLDYAYQWKTKKQGFMDALRRVQVEFKEALEEFPADIIWNYRNRIGLRGERDALGFFAAHSHQLVSIENCAIARHEINQYLPKIREKGKRFSKPFKVDLEITESSILLEHWNEAYLFRQVHDEQNLKLRHWVKQNIIPGYIVWDLFGGSGNLSVDLPGQASEIHCVDRFVLDHKVPGLQYHRSSVLDWLKKQIPDSAPKSAIIDPPRGGLGKSLSIIEPLLVKSHVLQILLIGCTSDSFARDLSHFIGKGWKLEKLGLLDFFPQTHHVEALAVLESRPDGACPGP